MADVINSLIGLAAVLLPVWIIWIVMHYKSRNRVSSGLSEEETRQLEELLATSERMAERIKTLESILDAENPEWREYQDEK